MKDNSFTIKEKLNSNKSIFLSTLSESIIAPSYLITYTEENGLVNDLVR